MKSLVKKLVFLLIVVVTFPLYALYRLNSLIIGTAKAFQGMSQFLSLFPGMMGSYLRKGFYSQSIQGLSPDCTIGFGTFLSSSKVTIGPYVYIGARCIIADSVIEKDVMIGSNVCVISGKATHDFSRVDIPMRLQGGDAVPLMIGEDTWIGNNAIIMANVGKKCIIGAGSVVTKDIEDYAIAVGNPAKVIRKRV
jgi:virginiamycin A acetyltransferase